MKTIPIVPEVNEYIKSLEREITSLKAELAKMIVFADKRNTIALDLEKQLVECKQIYNESVEGLIEVGVK